MNERTGKIVLGLNDVQPGDRLITELADHGKLYSRAEQTGKADREKENGN